MRNLFTYPAIEIKNFETENIVTVSGQEYAGEKYTAESITALKSNSSFTRAVVNANEVLHFN